jgi:glucokinase
VGDGNDADIGRCRNDELSICRKQSSEMKSTFDKNPARGKKKQSAKPLSENPVKGQRVRSRRIGKERRVVAGIDIGGTNLRVALAELDGTVLGRWQTSTKATSSPEMVVAKIEEGVDSLLRESSSSRRALVSVAAGAPGVTDPKAGVVLATSFLKGWKDVPLQRQLESALGVPASIENDVRMAALGEHWMGTARGVDDFVFLAIGTGIAAGIFANGRLVHGTNCAAGEVGYMYVPHVPEEPAGPGQPGALESVIGGMGIQRQWSSACDGNVKPHSLTATEIFSRVSQGDPLATKVLQHSAQILAYAVYNISLVLNSALFVLGGGIGVSIPLCDATQKILERYREPALPKLAISSLGTDAQMMGAIRLALTTAKQPKRT